MNYCGLVTNNVENLPSINTYSFYEHKKIYSLVLINTGYTLKFLTH